MHILHLIISSSSSVSPFIVTKGSMCLAEPSVVLLPLQLSHLRTSAEALKESNTDMSNKVESYMQKLKEVSQSD